jgi:hypothetical protein
MKKIVLTTSLYRLRRYNACSGRYAHLVDKLGPKWGDKDEINLLDILRHNGTADCLWALCATVKHPEGDKVMRLMAADFAEAVLPIFEKEYPKDDRPRKAIQAARDFANGKITDQERDAASAAAGAASAAAGAAGDAAWAAGDAAWAAAWAAAGAARDAARAARGAARDAARAARDAAWAAARAARDAAWAARDARAEQAKIIRKYLGR